MRITCTAPNGAKFEASANLWVPQDKSHTSTSTCEEHNRRERQSLQNALATWCEAMGAKPETAEVS